MPQFCRNFKNLSSPFDGLESGERVCIGIAIQRHFACAENICSNCSVIRNGVNIFENGWIAENRISPEPYELTVKAGLGKPMRVLWESTRSRELSSSIHTQVRLDRVD